MASRLLIVYAATVAILACDNSLGPDSVGSIAVTIDHTTLVEGEGTAIGVSAVDVDGSSISSSEVTWISRDPTTARVENGSVFGVAPGVTTIVADVRGARDSVRIRVRFGNLAAGEIGVRVQGHNGIRQATEGQAYVQRFVPFGDHPALLPEHTFIRTVLGGQAFPAAGVLDLPTVTLADTVMMIAFEGSPTVGTHSLEGFEVVESEYGPGLRGTDGAFLQVHRWDQNLQTELLLPVDGVDLVLDSVDLPAEDGGLGGRLRGAVAFEAAGIVLTFDPQTHRVSGAAPGGDSTVHVYAEFETSIADWIIGGADVTITQNGEEFTQYSAGQATAREDGVDFVFNVGRVESGATAPTEFVTIRTRGSITGPGTFDVSSVTRDDFATQDPTHDPEGPIGTWAALSVRTVVTGSTVEPPLQTIGFSQAGTIAVSEYRAPTENRLGMIRGTYQVTLSLYDPSGSPTGETMDATAEFALPIVPRCGLASLCQ